VPNNTLPTVIYLEHEMTDEERLLWILKFSLETKFEDADPALTAQLIESQILLLKLQGYSLDKPRQPRPSLPAGIADYFKRD